MKHLLLSALLLVGLAAGCKSGSDPTPTPTPAPATATLLAKWKVDSIYQKTPGTRGFASATIYTFNSYYWEFTSTYLIGTNNGGQPDQEPYTQSGNVLTFQGAQKPITRTIVQLTAHRLVLTELPGTLPATTAVRQYSVLSR